MNSENEVGSVGSSVTSVQIDLKKWLGQAARRLNRLNMVDRDARVAVLRLAEAYLQALRHQKSMPKRKRKLSAKKLTKFEKTLFTIIERLANHNSIEIADASCDLVISLNSAMGFDLLEGNILGPNERIVVENLFRRMAPNSHDHLFDADTTALKLRIAFCKKHYEDLYAEIRSNFQAISRTEWGKYSLAGQEFLMSFAEKEGDLPKAILIDESQSVAIGQLAYALLSSWTSSTEGAASQESFELLRQYAETYMNLTLFGRRGEVVKFNESAWQGSGLTEGDRVKTIRPGVQWTDGKKVKVILRAIAEPTK